MEINWSKLNTELDFEHSLLKATIDCIDEFANKTTEDETYYAFAYDIELQQGHFGLCLNSIEYLDKQIANNYKEATEAQLDEIKYNPGDWKYQAFNKFEFKSVKNIWDLVIGEKLIRVYEVLEAVEYNEDIAKGQMDEIYYKLILDITNSIESVIDILKKEHCFPKLKKSKDFKIFWIHMQEEVHEILHRLN